MYHDPCHTPMKVYEPLRVAGTLMGADVALSDRCCGESGTLATSRPTSRPRSGSRKEEEMRRGAAALRSDGFDGKVKVLTSCPSCLHGLSRFSGDAGTDADYIVVERRRGACSARAGWRITSPGPTAEASSASWSDAGSGASGLAGRTSRAHACA